jgi:hypothetical protein
MESFTTPLAVIACIAFLVARATNAYATRRQRPFSAYTNEEIRMAFRYAPEQRAPMVNRGTMSRLELGLLHRLNLQRIDAELKRRGIVM